MNPKMKEMLDETKMMAEADTPVHQAEGQAVLPLIHTLDAAWAAAGYNTYRLEKALAIVLTSRAFDVLEQVDNKALADVCRVPVSLDHQFRKIFQAMCGPREMIDLLKTLQNALVEAACLQPGGSKDGNTANPPTTGA